MINNSFERRNSLDDTIGHQNIFDLSKYSHQSLSGQYYLMSKPFRVVDVYDVAAEIGKDFERIIDQFGSEAVQGLMPKVIGVLEELEEYAQKYESESKEMVHLQTTVQKLELEIVGRIQERARHEKELEQIEDAWRAETGDLMQMVERLQDDNKKLQEELDGLLDSSEEQETARTKVANDDIQLMIRLKEMVDRQTQEIRELKKELAQKCLDLDAMQQQSERLAKLNAELRRKHCVSKKQSDQLLEEKSVLQLELCEKETEIKQMRGAVVLAEASLAGGIEHAEKGLSVEEEDGPEGRRLRPGNQEFAESLARLSEAQLIEQINMEGKMAPAQGHRTAAGVASGTIRSQSGSAGARYSLTQLKAVLIERNELKSKLIEVEEELAVYRNAGDDDPPVQGPVNREPDEKMSPKYAKESGIQRFFKLRLKNRNYPV